jgi:hypothetical protein
MLQVQVRFVLPDFKPAVRVQQPDDLARITGTGIGILPLVGNRRIRIQCAWPGCPGLRSLSPSRWNPLMDTTRHRSRIKKQLAQPA